MGGCCSGAVGDVEVGVRRVMPRGPWGPRTRTAKTRVPHEGGPTSKCVCWGCGRDGEVKKNRRRRRGFWVDTTKNMVMCLKWEWAPRVRKQKRGKVTEGVS